ncbi:MAG: oxidoreductase [Halanaerobiales bacterium]
MKDDKWSVEQIESLDDKVLVVTGGNSGIGYEAVRIFALKGARVIMACRSMDRANKARLKIQEENPLANIDIIKLDLSDLESIHDFADKFKKKFNRLDVLLNNAGIMLVPYGKTEDGFEKQMGVNHLGHFALTALLFDRLKATNNSRVINISSTAHKRAEMDFDNFMFENGAYSPWKSYARSKLANLLFTYELQRRIEDNNLNMKSLAAHPGMSNTNLNRKFENNFFYKLFGWFFEMIGQSPRAGSLPTIRAATDTQAEGGEYYGPSGLFEIKGRPVVVESSPASHDLEDAERLWEISEELTDVKFKI